MKSFLDSKYCRFKQIWLMFMFLYKIMTITRSAMAKTFCNASLKGFKERNPKDWNPNIYLANGSASNSARSCWCWFNGRPSEISLILQRTDSGHILDLSCLLRPAAGTEVTAGFLSWRVTQIIRLAHVGYKAALAANSPQLGLNRKSK